MFTRTGWMLIVALALLGLGKTAQAEFTSGTVSGLSLWLKADAGVVATGDEVDIWMDQSGNARDLWADSTTMRPLLATATIGGATHDVLRFDGVDDVLTLDVPNSGFPRQAHTAYFVAARTGGDSETGSLFGFDRTGGRATDGWYYKFTDAGVNMESGANAPLSEYGYQLLSGEPDNEFLIGEGRYSSTTTTAQLFINGELRDKDAATAATLNEPAATRFNVGAFDIPGGTTPPTGFTNFFNGDIAEILVFDHALTTTDQETVRTYLDEKYGIEPYTPPEPLPLELKAKWSFDQDGSDSVGDSPMTLQGEAAIASGKVGNGLAVTSSATEGYASTPADADLDASHQFSMAMWLRYDENNSEYARAVSRLQDADNGYNIAFQNSDDPTMAQLVVRVKREGADYFVTTEEDVLEQDTFHHVAFAYDELEGSTATDHLTLWIDGVEVNTVDTTGAGGVQGGSDLVLGRGTASSAEFSGILDEVCFYGGVLTQDEIDNLVGGEEPLPGDLNDDGFVGGDDLDIVRSFWGRHVAVGDLESGDPSKDGFVGGDDLDIVRANWGQGSPPAPNVVPEPEAMALLLVGLGILALMRPLKKGA